MRNRDSIMKYVITLTMLLSISIPISASITIVGELVHTHSAAIGTSYSGVVEIANVGNRNERVQLRQNDYLYTADGYNIFNNPGSDPRSNAPWITLLQDDIVIAPGKTAKVPYTVQVPPNSALCGSYWSLLFVQAITDSLLNPDRPDDSRVELQANLRYGVQIITDIGESGKKIIHIDNIQVSKIENEHAIHFNVNNIGEKSVFTNIYAQVYTDKGKYVGRFDGNRRKTLPGCSINTYIQFPHLEEGRYRMQIIADGGGNDVFGILVAPQFN